MKEYVILKIMGFIGMTAYIPIRFAVAGCADLESAAGWFFVICAIATTVPQKYFREAEEVDITQEEDNLLDIMAPKVV